MFAPSVFFSREDSFIVLPQATWKELTGGLALQQACRRIAEREVLMRASTLEIVDLPLDKLFSVEKEWLLPVGWSSRINDCFPRIHDLFIEQSSLQRDCSKPTSILWQKVFNGIVSHLEDTENSAACRRIVARLPHVKEFRQILSDRSAKPKPSSSEDALEDLYLYVPIAYRLALGREAAQLRERAIASLFPHPYSRWKSAIRAVLAERIFGFSELDQWIMSLNRDISDLLRQAGIPVFAVFSRVKATSSVIDKVLKYWRLGADPKDESSDQREIQSFLYKFKKILLTDKGESITDDELASVLGDFLGINIVIDVNSEADVKDRVYAPVMRKVVSRLIKDVRSVTGTPRRPYHQRLLIEGRVAITPCGYLPIEIQAQSILDYLFGCSYYWKYKNVRVFDHLYPESTNDLFAVKDFYCTVRSEETVQDLVFQQIRKSIVEGRTTGAGKARANNSPDCVKTFRK